MLAEMSENPVAAQLMVHRVDPMARASVDAVFLLTRKSIVDGQDRRGRPDRVLQAESQENGILDPIGKIQRVKIAHRLQCGFPGTMWCGRNPRVNLGKVLSDCASTHAVATTIMETEPWDFTAVYYDAIDHFSHAFMQFHPPQMENVEDDAFEIYRDMVLQAEAADPRMPGLYVQIGNVYLRLRRYAEAERAFKRAIEIHDDSAAAHQGLSFPRDIANVDVATAREESCGDAPPDSGSTGRDEYDLSWSNSVHGD